MAMFDEVRSGGMGQGSSQACPCCGYGETHLFYTVLQVPVHSSVLLDSRETALGFPKGDLELAFCNACGFISNRAFDERLVRYGEDFEESQHFSGTFSSYARTQADEIARRCDIAGKTVLEIGCGKGEFLAEVCRGGRARGIGIDPAYRPDAGRSARQDHLEFIVDNFGPAYAHLAADLVLCRHTLEHIFDVRSFVGDIRRMCPDGDGPWVVFETPDSERVLMEGAFWDIYYEHCSYFSAGTHARLFRNEGFDVTGLELVYDDQYIVQYARPAAGPTAPRFQSENDLDVLRRLVDAFPARVSGMQRFWRDRITQASVKGRDVVLWGGGSKAVSFLTTLGIGEEVAAAVDINPYKQGRFMAGSGHPVVAPEALTALRPGLVIVMNPVYVAEISAMLGAMGLEPEVAAL